MLRSVWMDGECNVSASYTSPSLLRALKGSAIEHTLWPDDGDGGAHPAGEPSIVIVADKGQQWTQARIDYRMAADTHMWFSECARGDDNADCGRHEGDWYYIRGGRRGRFVAFVRGRNVVVYDTLVRKDTQLTWAAAEGVQYGAVDLPMEEELGRTTGIFWAPPSTQAPAVDMLLCARVDERAVLEVGLPELPVESKINPLATLVSNPTALFASEAYGWSSGCQSTGAADKRAG
ncbi:peptidase, partial [Coemansia biformis]